MSKINTKEYFKVFHLEKEDLSAKMAEQLKELLLKERSHIPQHAVVAFPENFTLSCSAYIFLEEVQTVYNQEDLSFVVANISPKTIKNCPVLKKLNTAPTLQEAIDILMMEKLERDLFAGEE